MHYDQEALYEMFKDFVNTADTEASLEVTESDCLEAFRSAKEATGYGTSDSCKIITSFVCPPIPSRGFDWCAHYDDDEESRNYGWGKNELEAKNDLIAKFKELS